MTREIVLSDNCTAILGDVIGILITNRQALADYPFSFPIEVQMPCDHKAEWATLEDLPIQTMLCSCGDPNHYFIKYEEES